MTAPVPTPTDPAERLRCIKTNLNLLVQDHAFLCTAMRHSMREAMEAEGEEARACALRAAALDRYIASMQKLLTLLGSFLMQEKRLQALSPEAEKPIPAEETAVDWSLLEQYMRRRVQLRETESPA